VPKHPAIRVEVKRGDASYKSKDVHITSGHKFPLHFNEKLNMISIFYVDGNDVQEKTMYLYLKATSSGHEETLAEASFDIGKFFSKKGENHTLRFKGDNFSLRMSISVVKVADSHSIGVDSHKMIREENAHRSVHAGGLVSSSGLYGSRSSPNNRRSSSHYTKDRGDHQASGSFSY